MKHSIKLLCALAIGIFAATSGCTSVNTFPAIARPGDTVSLMIGGSEMARKENVSVTLTDSNNQTWDMKALGRVRSVFNLRTDGRAYGQHYSPYLDSYISWVYGHEPLQTVLVASLPATVAPGQANLTIVLNSLSDNSSGVNSPFNVKLEIIPGTGTAEQFRRVLPTGNMAVDFTQMETAPNAKVTFGTGSTPIGAISMVIDFDETVVTPGDLNVYVPESAVRGDYVNAGVFGKTQRMVYWHQDGKQLYVDIVAPQGIDPRYLQFFVVHPHGLAGTPAFNILSALVYDTGGNAIAVVPTLTYLP